MYVRLKINLALNLQLNRHVLDVNFQDKTFVSSFLFARTLGPYFFMHGALSLSLKNFIDIQIPAEFLFIFTVKTCRVYYYYYFRCLYELAVGTLFLHIFWVTWIYLLILQLLEIAITRKMHAVNCSRVLDSLAKLIKPKYLTCRPRWCLLQNWNIIIDPKPPNPIGSELCRNLLLGLVQIEVEHRSTLFFFGMPTQMYVYYLFTWPFVYIWVRMESICFLSS